MYGLQVNSEVTLLYIFSDLHYTYDNIVNMCNNIVISVLLYMKTE